MIGDPIGSIGKAHPSRLTNLWFQHFVEYAKSPKCSCRKYRVNTLLSSSIWQLYFFDYIVRLEFNWWIKISWFRSNHIIVKEFKFFKENEWPSTPYEILELFERACIKYQIWESAANDYKVGQPKWVDWNQLHNRESELQKN